MWAAGPIGTKLEEDSHRDVSSKCIQTHNPIARFVSRYATGHFSLGERIWLRSRHSLSTSKTGEIAVAACVVLIACKAFPIYVQ